MAKNHMLAPGSHIKSERKGEKREQVKMVSSNLYRSGCHSYQTWY